MEPTSGTTADAESSPHRVRRTRLLTANIGPRDRSSNRMITRFNISVRETFRIPKTCSPFRHASKWMVSRLSLPRTRFRDPGDDLPPLEAVAPRLSPDQRIRIQKLAQHLPAGIEPNARPDNAVLSKADFSARWRACAVIGRWSRADFRPAAPNTAGPNGTAG